MSDNENDAVDGEMKNEDEKIEESIEKKNKQKPNKKGISKFIKM